MNKTPRPADYVLIDGDKVYDVRCVGGGPYLWMMMHYERAKPPPPPRWWRRWVTAGLASARWAALVWLVHKLSTLYFETMRPS